MTDLARPRVVDPTFTPMQLDRHPAAVYLASLPSPASRRTQAEALDTIAEMVSGGTAASGRCNKLAATRLTLNWSALRYQHTAAIRSALMARFAPAGVNRRLSALRGVIRECARLGLMSREDAAAAADVDSVRGDSAPAGRALTEAELAAIFAACDADPSPLGLRDGAILAVLFGCGLRRSELVALDLDDFHPDTGEFTVICGKGRKRRTVWAPSGTAARLAAWLEYRDLLPAVFGLQPSALSIQPHDSRKLTAESPLFLGFTWTGEPMLRRPTAECVYRMVARRAAQAGVQAPSPHDFRRTYVTALLDAGVDVGTVQKLAGHASVNTTLRYDRRGEAAKREAADRLHVPGANSSPPHVPQPGTTASRTR